MTMALLMTYTLPDFGFLSGPGPASLSTEHFWVKDVRAGGRLQVNAFSLILDMTTEKFMWAIFEFLGVDAFPQDLRNRLICLSVAIIDLGINWVLDASLASVSPQLSMHQLTR